MPVTEESQSRSISPPGVSPARGVVAQSKTYSRADRIAIAFIAAMIIGLSGMGFFGTSGTSLLSMVVESDQISEQQATDRVRVYNLAAPLELRIVPSGEIQQALSTMNLSDNDKQILLSELGISTPAQTQPAGSRMQRPSSNPPAAPSAPDAGRSTPAGNTAGAVAAQAAPTQIPRPAAATSSPLRLAWITLWDTDAQDGDMVRIDSSGFSTVVTLSNTPVTFAVPVPERGVVNVTGVRDGGGGITVGATSGVQRVALPVMSVGQVLGVPVVAR